MILILPVLRIGDRVARYPFVQGGMAVRVSTGRLAAAVAAAGGVGTIAGTGMSCEELRSEIRYARSQTDGIIGVNVLFAIRDFAALVRTAIEEKVDFIVSGAGFSRDMFRWGKESGTSIISIVSSGRLAAAATRLGAAAIVAEGGEAGGHLGTFRPLKEVFREVREATDLPVIAAGGIVTGEEAAEYFRLGADGVQLGTRFVASDECAAADAFKKVHLGLKEEDIVIIQSPVGMPGRAIRNRFTDSLQVVEPHERLNCQGCLKHCSRQYCILEELALAQKGDVENGVLFTGTGATRISQIKPAAEIVAELVEGAEGALKAND